MSYCEQTEAAKCQLFQMDYYEVIRMSARLFQSADMIYFQITQYNTVYSFLWFSYLVLITIYN